MRLVSFLTCGGVLALGMLAASAAEEDHGKSGGKEFPLKYRLAFATVQNEVGHCGQYLQVTKRTRWVRGEPKYKSKEPLHVTVTLGAKKQKFLLVFDASSGQNRGHDTLYFDADGDGKFTDKEKFTGMDRDSGRIFGPVKVMVDCHKKHDDKCPQWFLVQFSEYDQGEGREVYRQVQLANAGYYEGTVAFGDKKMLLAFADGDGNGLYNDLMTIHDPRTADKLLLDLNGDGKLDGGYESEEALPLGRCIEVAGKYWQMDVSPDGSSVSVEPLNRPLGSVQLPVKDCTLLLAGRDGLLQVRTKDGTAKVPGDLYRLHSCRYRMVIDGKAWKFSAQAQNAPTLEVPPDEETKIKFGAPLVPKVSVSPAGRELHLNLQLRGAGGEVYNDVQIGGNYQRPPVPGVKILDAKDRLLTQLDFHYG